MATVSEQSVFWVNKLDTYSVPDKLKSKLDAKPDVIKCRIRELFKLIAIQRVHAKNGTLNQINAKFQFDTSAIERLLVAVDAVGVFRNPEYTMKGNGYNLLLCEGDVKAMGDKELASKLHHLGQSGTFEEAIPVDKSDRLSFLQRRVSQACASGDLDLAMKMIDSGAKFTTQLLVPACEAGHVIFCFEVLKRITPTMSTYDKTLYVDIQKDGGLFGVAAKKGFESLVVFLTQHYHISFKHNRILLGYYCCNNLEKLAIQYIHDAGIKDSEVFQTLYAAAEKGLCDIVELVLSKISHDRLNGEYRRGVDNAVYIACQRGDSEIAELLLDSGMAPINKFRLGKFCEKGEVGIIRRILDAVPTQEIRRAKLESKDYNGYTLLMKAAKGGSQEIVSLLLMEGADPLSVCKQGKTALMFAAENGHLDALRQILSKVTEGELEDYVNLSCRTGTALSGACMSGSLDVVKELINAGANPLQCLSGPYSPIVTASKKGFVDVVDFILMMVSQHTSEAIIADPIGEAFLAACKEGHQNVADRFFKYCKDDMVVLLAGGSISSSLYHAANNGMTETVDALLQMIPPDIKSELINQLEGEKTPLLVACEKGHIDTVNILIHHEADLTLADANGVTPLYWAIKNGSAPVVESILGCLDVDAAHLFLDMEIGSEKETALVMALRNGRVDMAKLLMDAGADITKVQEKAGSLFFDAAKNGSLEVIKIIVSISEPDQVKEYLETEYMPLHHTSLITAIDGGHSQMAKFLIDAGANVTKCIPNKEQALYEFAHDKGMKSVERCIVEKLKGLYMQGITHLGARKISYPIQFFQIPSLYGNDRVIRATDGEHSKDFYVNSEIISAESEFFKSMFQGGFKEGKEAMVTFEGYPPAVFEALLTYIYTGQLDLNHDNVKELIQLSNEFLLSDLQKKLRVWVLQHPECSNWMKKLTLTRRKPDFLTPPRVIGACSSSSSS